MGVLMLMSYSAPLMSVKSIKLRQWFNVLGKLFEPSFGRFGLCGKEKPRSSLLMVEMFQVFWFCEGGES